ncbi:hypothetical protein MRB53_039128 [Persea americana]|nr:hypothetical protein MRB53_039128 [Persea americana]
MTKHKVITLEHEPKPESSTHDIRLSHDQVHFELESNSSDSDYENDINDGEDQSHVPRHQRLGREIRILRRSKVRLCMTIVALLVFWVIAVVGVAMVRTSGYYRNPFNNAGDLPSFPH